MWMWWIPKQQPRFDKETNMRKLARKLDDIEARIIELEGNVMSSFDELKAAQDATDAKIAAVKADVERLIEALANVPAPGLTAEQQAALDAAVARATAINEALSGVDALTPEPAPEPDPEPTPEPDPEPAPVVDPETPVDPEAV
jgi:hypothetical protein